MTHTGRPIIREAKGGGTLILCPYGHVYHHIPPREWGGSIWEAHAGDPKWTVTCGGTIPCTCGHDPIPGYHRPHCWWRGKRKAQEAQA